MPLKANPPNTLKKQPEPNFNLNLEKNLKEQKKEFVQEANKHSPIKEIISSGQGDSEKIYPWNTPSVREDVTKLFNIRLSEPDWLKLKYLSDQTNESMHAICLDILIPTMSRRLKKLVTSHNEN